MKPFTCALVLLAAPLSLLAAGAPTEPPDIHHEIDAGLEEWQWHDGATTVTLRQRLPDQSRAYFTGRGFEAADADIIATRCVFQAVVRNLANAGPAMEVDLADWRVIEPGREPRPPYLERDWERLWTELKVPMPGRIAFRWSLFPTVQRFEPGDWNMGMVTMDLPPQSEFDLFAVWRRGDKFEQVRFPGLRCAPDRHL